jgi:hypothetical protein
MAQDAKELTNAAVEKIRQFGTFEPNTQNSGNDRE